MNKLNKKITTNKINITAKLVNHWRRQKGSPINLSVAESTIVIDSPSAQVIRPTSIPSEEAFGTPRLITYPDILLQATIVLSGDNTKEGVLITGVAVPWFEIIRQIERDPEFLFKIPWRKMEELIAGAYERAGWPEVILTPRSRNHGRDIIVTKPGIGSIRIIDQVKAYSPGRKVTADEVRSMLGVLQADRNVSKGVVTTTSQFAPSILGDEQLKAFMPYRLELKDGTQLMEWLIELLTKGFVSE